MTKFKLLLNANAIAGTALTLKSVNAPDKEKRESEGGNGKAQRHLNAHSYRD